MSEHSAKHKNTLLASGSGFYIVLPIVFFNLSIFERRHLHTTVVEYSNTAGHDISGKLDGI